MGQRIASEGYGKQGSTNYHCHCSYLSIHVASFPFPPILGSKMESMKYKAPESDLILSSLLQNFKIQSLCLKLLKPLF
jgi:hypothetical protein